MLNAGSVIGRTVPNYFADKWGRFNGQQPLNFLCRSVFVLTALSSHHYSADSVHSDIWRSDLRDVWCEDRGRDVTICSTVWDIFGRL